MDEIRLLVGGPKDRVQGFKGGMGLFRKVVDGSMGSNDGRKDDDASSDHGL